LRRRSDFLDAQARGKRVHTRHFVLLVLASDRDVLGITVTRKVANAVGRNRVKRLWREVYRRNRDLFPAGCTVVAVARTGAAELDYAAVRAEVAAASPMLHRMAGAGAKPSPGPESRG
jgi:ribonuclease P protein component